MTPSVRHRAIEVHYYYYYNCVQETVVNRLTEHHPTSLTSCKTAQNYGTPILEIMERRYTDISRNFDVATRLVSLS